MTLKIHYHSNNGLPENQKHYIDGKAKVVHTMEGDKFWPGQQKHVGWLEGHNEDVDTHYMNSDMDLDKETKEKK